MSAGLSRQAARGLSALSFAILPGLSLGLILSGKLAGWLLLPPSIAVLALFLQFVRDGVFDD